MPPPGASAPPARAGAPGRLAASAAAAGPLPAPSPPPARNCHSSRSRTPACYHGRERRGVWTGHQAWTWGSSINVSATMVPRACLTSRGIHADAVGVASPRARAWGGVLRPTPPRERPPTARHEMRFPPRPSPRGVTPRSPPFYAPGTPPPVAPSCFPGSNTAPTPCTPGRRSPTSRATRGEVPPSAR